MSSEQDGTEFVDDDFQPGQPAAPANPWAAPASNAPTREQVDTRVVEAQQKLAELKRQQEDLERERATLEEIRRRQMEFHNGRKELLHNLTRGVGLLEESEFSARRDAELMAKTMAEFKDALTKLETIDEEAWTQENFHIELTRALTTIENARMEWNSARLKLPVLAGESGPAASPSAASAAPAAPALTTMNFWQLCRLGLAMTWPLLLVALLALGIFIALLVKRH
jgi:hypothetical protein